MRGAVQYLHNNTQYLYLDGRPRCGRYRWAPQSPDGEQTGARGPGKPQTAWHSKETLWDSMHLQYSITND